MLTLTRDFNANDYADLTLWYEVQMAGRVAGLDIIKAAMAAKFADDRTVSIKDGTLCDKPMPFWDKWDGGVEATPGSIQHIHPARADDPDYHPSEQARTLAIFNVREPVKGGWTNLFREKLGFRDQIDILRPEWLPMPEQSKKWFGPYGSSSYHGTYEQQKQYGHFEVAVELPTLLEHLDVNLVDYQAQVNAAHCAKAAELGVTLKQPQAAHDSEIVTVPTAMGKVKVFARHALGLG